MTGSDGRRGILIQRAITLPVCNVTALLGGDSTRDSKGADFARKTSAEQEVA
jgi:hypothetical protein